MGGMVEYFIEKTKGMNPEQLESYLDQNMARKKSYTISQLRKLSKQSGLELNEKRLFAAGVDREDFLNGKVPTELVVITNDKQLLLADLCGQATSRISYSLSNGKMVVFAPKEWEQWQRAIDQDFSPAGH